MEKVIRENKVAVLISPSYGAGWYTWNQEHKQLLFHPKIVEMVESKRRHEITEEWVEKNLGIKDVYCGGANDLEIHWLEQGTAFSVDEYDGSEALITITDLILIA